MQPGPRFDGASLSYFANWITPAVLPIRFDTRFYAGLVVDEGIEPEPDGEELDLAQWVAPSEALEAGTIGSLAGAVPHPEDVGVPRFVPVGGSTRQPTPRR